MITIREKRIYIEIAGALNSPVLLYLHGGPGAGSYDFGLYQNNRLSQHLQLIMMDQYGVLRSDPLDEDEQFGLQYLIMDCETLRKHLEIESWSILGHSFGGYLALLYALDYPDHVDSLILECPTFHMVSSARSLLRGAALEYRKIGKNERAEECIKAAESSKSPIEIWEDFSNYTNGLGDMRNNLYVHGEEKDFFDKLVANSPFPKEWWEKQNIFQKKLYAEKLVFESVIPRISEINCPMLLICGSYDWVTADDQIEAFCQESRCGRVMVFENSSHFPRVEESELYARTVTNFIMER